MGWESPDGPPRLSDTSRASRYLVPGWEQGGVGGVDGQRLNQKAGGGVSAAAALAEGAISAEEDGHEGVGVVLPPDGGAGGGVAAECFPGAPEGVEAVEGFGVAPPLGAPVVVCAVDAYFAGVGDSEEVGDPFGDRPVQGGRRGDVDVIGRGRWWCGEVVVEQVVVEVAGVGHGRPAVSWAGPRPAAGVTAGVARRAPRGRWAWTTAASSGPRVPAAAAVMAAAWGPSW